VFISCTLGRLCPVVFVRMGVHCCRLSPAPCPAWFFSLVVRALMSELPAHAASTRDHMITPKLSYTRTMVRMAGSLFASYLNRLFLQGSQDWSEPFRRYTGLT